MRSQQTRSSSVATEPWCLRARFACSYRTENGAPMAVSHDAPGAGTWYWLAAHVAGRRQG